MTNKTISLFLAALISGAANASDPFTVKNIKINGLQRYEKGTVLSYIPVKVGSLVNEDSSSKIIRSLYATGFFQDVSLQQNGNTLVINLVERPAIGELKISGNKDIKTKDLLAALKDVGLSPGRTFSHLTLERIKQELERQYHSMGKYSAKIDVTIKKQERNRVAINIDIFEGVVAKIKSIDIIGNKAYSDKKLLSLFKLSSSNLFYPLSKRNQYSKEKLTTDIEALRSFYLNNGYINFNIESTQISISDDKRDVYITLSIVEGNSYSITDVNLSGDFVVPKDELAKLVTVKPGDIFSRRAVMDSASLITDRLGEEGFAYANVNPVPQIDDDSQTVALTLVINPGNRVYVRNINFKGNAKTNDEVLRREVTQMESAYLASTKVKQSVKKLNQVGYFSNVDVNTNKVPGTTDLVDLTFDVEETPSGSIQGGIGFSDAEGILINASVSNRNFLGTGNSVNFEFNNNKSYTTYNVGYTNPYVTIDGLSRGFNLFYNETDLSEISSVSNYSTDSFGGNLTYGMPISEQSRITFGYGAQRTKLSVNRSYAPNEIINFINDNGSSYLELALSTGWKYNSLNRFIFPDSGFSHSLNFNVTIPGSDLQYFRLSYAGKWFKALGHDYVFNFNGNLGYGDGYGKTDKLPFYKHFFAGGTRAVRGYAENSLGPKDSNGRPYGGNLSAYGSMQMILPNYFAQNNKTVRFAVFFDAGQVYDLQDKIITNNNGDKASRNPDGLRFSTGVSVTWISPLGPLVFSLAKPINKHSSDETQAFAFSVGTFFN